MPEPSVSPPPRVQILTVRKHAGQRLDNYLFREIKTVPKSRLHRAIRRGEIRLNGKRTKGSTKLAVGDKVRIPPFRVEEAKPLHCPDWLVQLVTDRIVSEDDRILLLNKPSGVAVHGGGNVQAGVVEALRVARPGQMFELCHRIDQATSGCLVIAKTRVALLEAHEAFRRGAVEKVYDAIVHGTWPSNVSEVALPLKRITTRAGERRVLVSEQGSEATTRFEICKRSSAYTWIRAKPITGRTHQIRVHAQSVGHPIVGDFKYLGQVNEAESNRLMLHATQISFGKNHRYSVSIDDALTDFWQALVSP